MNDSIVTYLNLLKEYDSYHDIKSNYVACTTAGTMHVPRNIARSFYEQFMMLGDVELSRRCSMQDKAEATSTRENKIYGIAFVEVGKRSYNYKRFKRKQV